METVNTVAVAADGAAAPPGFGGGSILLIVLFIAVFYFIAIRPQNKQMNEKRAMISNIRAEDAVVTIGGIHGVVVKADEDEDTLFLRVAPGVEIEFLKAAVQNITNRDWREEFPQFQKKGLFAPRENK
ncbi:MAG: preprotein translocase subunit YajC [Gracilibacteraceae bacterium]|jgi:preprotein translocase subunit YajC|nr:preprotein translocase subunit YajC [Gracilibacteraceae bacterium]